MWKTFRQTAAVCAGLILIVGSLSLKRVPTMVIDQTPPLFDGHQSFKEVEALVKGFPNRVTWSESRKKAAAHLNQRLRNMGYAPQSMHFSEVIAGKKVEGLENIYAEKRGKTRPNEIIMLVAHYDAPENSPEAAMDDGSGVGIVLELARVLSKVETDRTILFLLSDSEEFGAMWGSHIFIRNYSKIKQVVAELNFDFISGFDLKGILNTHDGFKEGYTPLWLREIALESIRTLGTVEAREMTNGLEHIQRAILIPASEHGEYLQAGIPALNWIGQPEDFTTIMRDYHHTDMDRLEFLKPEALDAYGKAAERLVRSVSALPDLPSDFRNGSYWKVTDSLYMEGAVVLFIHILTMIPFLVITAIRAREVFQKAGSKVVRSVIYNELKSSAVLLGALFIGYGVLLLLPSFQVIDQYEMYPATQKSAILYHPNAIAIILVLASVGIAYLILSRLFSTRDDDLDFPDVRQTVHGLLLALVVFLAFLKNSYLATLLLLPPAYFWLLLRWRKRPEGRILNALIVLSGALSLGVMAIVMSQIFYVGVFYWYLFLSTAYGLFSAYSIVLFLIALAVMIRLIRRFSF